MSLAQVWYLCVNLWICNYTCNPIWELCMCTYNLWCYRINIDLCLCFICQNQRVVSFFLNNLKRKDLCCMLISDKVYIFLKSSLEVHRQILFYNLCSEIFDSVAEKLHLGESNFEMKSYIPHLTFVTPQTTPLVQLIYLWREFFLPWTSHSKQRIPETHCKSSNWTNTRDDKLEQILSVSIPQRLVLSLEHVLSLGCTCSWWKNPQISYVCFNS